MQHRVVAARVTQVKDLAQRQRHERHRRRIRTPDPIELFGEDWVEWSRRRTRPASSGG
jgi:hypothetical protein